MLSIVRIRCKIEFTAQDAEHFHFSEFHSDAPFQSLCQTRAEFHLWSEPRLNFVRHVVARQRGVRTAYDKLVIISIMERKPLWKEKTEVYRFY
jgi:hypothetical protein